MLLFPFPQREETSMQRSLSLPFSRRRLDVWMKEGLWDGMGWDRMGWDGRNEMHTRSASIPCRYMAYLPNVQYSDTKSVNLPYLPTFLGCTEDVEALITTCPPPPTLPKFNRVRVP